MSGYLRASLGILFILYFYMVMHFIKKKTLALRYALLWLFAGLAMGLLLLFPQVLPAFVQAAGIETPIYGLFLAGIFFSLMTGMLLTAIVSRQAERIKSLAQDNALMEKRIRELERNMEDGA